MKERRRVIAIDEYEYSVIIRALNEYRNRAIECSASTYEVDTLLLKIIDAPEKRVKALNARG